MTTFPAVVFVLSGAAASYSNTALGASTASIGYVQQSGTAQWAIKTTDITATGTLTAAAQTVPILLSGQSTVNVEISGTWTGSLAFEGLVSATWNPVNGVSSSTSGPATTTTVNGAFRLTPAAFAQLRVNAVTLLSGAAVINIRGSTGAGGIYANQILPTKLTNGTADAGVEPFGALVANTGYQTLFYDEWATSPIDTTDKWTVTGTTPGVASGLMTMVATVSTYNAIQTKDAVRPNVGFSLVRNGISIETAVSTGAGRFWGLGTPATVPAAAVLAQNGIGYELDQATGALLAVTYAAGVRTTVATLTRPTDGAIHGYGLYFRVTQAYWILDGVTVASQAFPNVAVAGLPALIVRQNAAALTGTPAFANIAHLTADTSRQGMLISDPVVGTRQARVNADGSLRVSGVAGGTALPVSGTFFQATQPVSLATNTPDVTDRAARLLGQVTNAGTFAVQATSTQLPAALGGASSAASLPVVLSSDTASGSITTQNLVPGGVATAGSAVEITLNGASTIGPQVTGTYTGALSLQVTVDGTNWQTVGGLPLLNVNTATYLASITSALTSIFQADVGSFTKARITALAAVTGTAVVTIRTATAASLVALDAAVTIGSGTVTTVSSLTTLSNGQTAHSSPSTGSPLRIGGRVNTAVDTTLVAGDASDLFMTTSGALVQKPFSVPELDWSFASAAGGITNTTDVALKAAGAAGVRNYITGMSIQNASATISTEVVLKDGATIIGRWFVGTQALLNSAVGITFPSPLKTTAATALNIACITTGSAVYVNAQGYQAT